MKHDSYRKRQKYIDVTVVSSQMAFEANKRKCL